MAQEKKTNMYNAAYGMRVSHERIIDWGLHTIVHHIEIETPGYELTRYVLLNIISFLTSFFPHFLHVQRQCQPSVFWSSAYFSTRSSTTQSSSKCTQETTLLTKCLKIVQLLWLMHHSPVHYKLPMLR